MSLFGFKILTKDPNPYIFIVLFIPHFLNKSKFNLSLSVYQFVHGAQPEFYSWSYHRRLNDEIKAQNCMNFTL